MACCWLEFSRPDFKFPGVPLNFDPRGGVTMIRKYGKALAAVATAALTVAYGALSGDQHIDPDEGVQIAIAAATAVGVYLVPLAPQYRWGKTAVAVVLSVLQVLATVILGGLDSNEWIALLLAALTVVGVGVAPAVSDNGVSSTKARVVDGETV